MIRSLLLLSLLALAGCHNLVEDRRPMVQETQSLDIGKATQLDATIEFPAGEFELLGGATKLVEGAYRFNHDQLRPVVDYQESGGVGRLRIHARKTGGLGNVKAIWELRLNDAVPVDLNLRMGAGKAEVNLGTLNLRRASVQFGAGEMTLDLRGKPQRGYQVEVNGGVGHGRIHLPGGVGVHANVVGGLGEISTQGELRKDGHDYYNGLWDKAERKVELKVRGGIGKIELIASE